MFLAVGVAATTGARRLWPVLLPAAVLALGLGGLPLTGGALAKLVVKTPVGDGAAGLLMSLSSAGTTLLMLHFLGRLAATEGTGRAADVAAVLAVARHGTRLRRGSVDGLSHRDGRSGSRRAVARCALVGDLAGAAGRRVGDRTAALGRQLAARSRRRCRGVGCAGATHFARATGLTLERLDGVLRQWPVAGVSLLALAVVLAALMLTGH